MRIIRGAGTVLVLQCFGIATASAQIATDGSMGPSVVLGGPNFAIGEALGTRVGSNLFHSFSDFNVQTGQSATFTSDFAGPTSNVISRVTGANVSVIDGLLRSEIAGADFWLINPNGLLFGANAQIDVPAGFHASTADVLELADGGTFRATNPNASSLTVAPPSAFGFLDSTVGSISIDGSQLAVDSGQTLSLVGGAQTLSNAQLAAPSGRVELVAVASAGQVAADTVTGAPEVTGISSFGHIFMGEQSTIDAGAVGAVSGGNVAIVASGIEMQFLSTIDVGTTGTGDAGEIVIQAADGVQVLDGARLLAESTSAAANAGNAGSVTIDVPVVEVSMGGAISVDTVGGAGGRITLNVDALSLRESFSLISADTHGSGRGGDIVIRGRGSTDSNVNAAGSVTLELFASMRSDSTGSGAAAGQAGTLTIHADSITFRQSSFVSVSTVDGAGTDASGEPVGGAIDLFTNFVNIEETGFLFADSTGAGQGGRISIQALDSAAPFRIVADENGAIKTSASGTGDAGSIVLGSADAPVDILQLGTPNLPFDDARGLFSESTALGPDAGAAGSITVFADRVEIQGAQLSVATVDGSGSDGSGGSITLHVGTLQLGTFGIITAATTGAGAGGDIRVLASGPDARPEVEFIDGRITTSTSGSGDAGRITLGSTDAPIHLLAMEDFEADAPDHVPNGFAHGLFSDSTGTGDSAGAGGQVTVFATNVEARNGGAISASTVDGAGGSIVANIDRLLLVSQGTLSSSTTGSGAGGTIALGVDTLTIDGGSIQATTTSTGDAGTIAITGTDGVAADSIHLNFRPSAITTSSFSNAADSGNSGSISVATRELTIREGSEISSSTAGGGSGGSVAIDVDTLSISGIDSKIAVGTTGTGDAGSIAIDGIDGAPATSVTLSGESAAIRSDASRIFGSPAEIGTAGSISIRAQSLTLDDLATVSVQTAGKSGGAIDIGVGTLSVTDGAVIDARTFASGDAGDIAIHGIDGGRADSVAVTGAVPVGPNAGIAARITSGSQGTDADAGAAGSIGISARNISVTDGGFVTAETDAGAGGTIELDAGENLSVARNGRVSSSTLGTGAGGSVVVTSDGAVLIDGGRIVAQSTSTGPSAGRAGDIAITADTVQLAVPEVGSTGIDASTVDGAGGSIALAVNTLQVEAGSIQASTSGTGNAGTITVTGIGGGAANRVSLNNADSAISTSSSSAGADAGNAGAIDISSHEIDVHGGARVSSATSGGGTGGSIRIGVDSLDVAADSSISVGTTASGDAGDILVEGVGAGSAATSVRVFGENAAIRSDSDRIAGSPQQLGASGNISIRAEDVSLDDQGRISVLTDGRAGGTIDIGANTLTVAGGATIDASTFESGDAGAITIHGLDGGRATSVLVTGVSGDETGGLTAALAGLPSSILSSSQGAGANAGAAGDIQISAETVTVEDGATISAGTLDGSGGTIHLDVANLTVGSDAAITASVSGAGAGGSIEIDADDRVLLDDGQLIAESTGTGASGSVTVNARELRLQNAAALSVRSTGAGRAGSVFTNLSNLILLGNSQIDATATSSLAGNVELNVTDIALLQDSLISGLSADPANDGGNFIIQKPKALVLQRSSILANSASGTGGNISITADAIVLDTESTVEATGELLTVGQVLGSVLQLEPPVVVDAAAALDTRCNSQQVEERSSMVVRTTPAGAVRDPYLSADAAPAATTCVP